HFDAGLERREAVRNPGLGIGTRIIYGDLNVQVAEIAPMIALDHVELAGVGMPRHVEPEFVVESDGVYYQRVALPMADGVSVPQRLEVLGVLFAVEEDLAEGVDVPFDQHHNQRGRLNDLMMIRSGAWHSGGDAAGFRIVGG